MTIIGNPLIKGDPGALFVTLVDGQILAERTQPPVSKVEIRGFFIGSAGLLPPCSPSRGGKCVRLTADSLAKSEGKEVTASYRFQSRDHCIMFSVSRIPRYNYIKRGTNGVNEIPTKETGSQKGSSKENAGEAVTDPKADL
jgi:hypothetical protein